jgi:5-methylthioribose kinase
MKKLWHTVYKRWVLAGDARPMYLDGDNRAETEHYVIARDLVSAGGLPIAVERAGAGNMNLTLRVMPAVGPSFILKQGRPWVEKYKQIPAPADRTLVEAGFYSLVQGNPFVAARMPAILDFDRDHLVLVLEDVGEGDFTSIYTDGVIAATTLAELLEWLEQLVAAKVPDAHRPLLANRAMRALNHEHIFRLPLLEDNGVDLDGITPGLRIAAGNLQRDADYCDAVTALGTRYLADGHTLVHGDYFPGSWLKTAAGVRVIDPEFCFLGDPEFDCGVMAAHLLIAQCDRNLLEIVAASVSGRGIDSARVAGYAGVEIMRRLIGVAQLPVSYDIDRKRALLERSRRLVLEPHLGFA